MKPRKPVAADVERRLFEISLGPLRLLDTALELAGQRVVAKLLRDLIMDWCAYPSVSVTSRSRLRYYVAKLSRVEDALRTAAKPREAALVDQIKSEIANWASKDRTRKKP